jgi:hypothetical protein
MKKLKSFGLIESVAASTILVVVVAGSLTLASSAIKTASSDQAYLEAENVAEHIFEKVQEKKSQGSAYFIKPVPSPAGSFSIKCFDTVEAYSSNECFESSGNGASKTGLDYLKSDMVASAPDVFVPYNRPANPAFGVGFFSYSVAVSTPEYFSGADGLFPEEKIVSVNIKIKWSDVGGEREYYARQYFSDWER